MDARRSGLLAAACLVAVALAGCAQDPAGPGTTRPTSTITPTPATTPVVDATPGISAITVGTDAAYPPFEDTVDGKIVGFDVDVLTEVGNRSGFTVTFQNSGFSNIIPSVQSGSFDAGMSAFTITDERKEQVDFSVSYYDNVLMAAVLSSKTGIDEAEDLRGRKVCTQEGTTSEFYLREQLGATNDTLVLLGTAPLCRDALVRGDVEAMMIDAAFVRNLVRGSEGQLKEAFTVSPDPPEQFGIVVKKGNTALLVAINAALTSMKADGTLTALKEKWQV